jgi:PEP-CTERM motif
MKKLVLVSAVLAVISGSTQAGVMLTTSNPPGTPLVMSAGTTSGPMLVSVLSDSFPNDVMSAWQFSLTIVADSGATGTLVFQDPATGSPPPPSNYIFDANGLGISVMNINGGSQLNANDFLDPDAGDGVPVPGAPGANLLQMDFQALSNASGLFGIYTLDGSANTLWNDANGDPQFFTNVPDNTGMVRIGEVLVASSVPEPSSLVLLAAGTVILAFIRRVA